MLTWSSWPAEDVIESTAAGWASVFISETSEAAVYWQTMNPAVYLGLADEERREPVGRLRSKSRYSWRLEMDASPTVAAARESQHSATGWPWKLPPERISAVSTSTTGLSETEASSISKVAAQLATTSRTAPCT